MNSFILEHSYFDKRLIAINEINKIKTDNNLVNFIENINRTFFYSFDTLIDNNEFIEEIKQFYSLSKKLPYNNLSENIAIICNKTSLSKYELWKLNTIRGIFVNAKLTKSQIYLFTQLEFDIMVDQTYKDYKNIPFNKIIPINNKVNEFNSLIQKHNVGTVLLFDAFTDNFQYFILKNYENAYCYKEYNIKLFDTEKIIPEYRDNQFLTISPNVYEFNKTELIKQFNLNRFANHISIWTI